MPLTRYQVRNEFSLADPELYRSADKDDPEALLEGVAMSGLVGVLRQLGDLAEFAAEMFHDLHEEVMATAARGHAQMARVKQLEAEFPSIEKSFLSRTGHSLFFTNAGVDWHPILRTEHNMVTHGDLPRCVLDSYEECRGPPRLFLLDKFDVAGAGACLKRYTNPSFFKAESAFPGIAPLEVQREKKVRKVKKKGSRWKNGEASEFPQTSHAKLHQLFLEEHINNAHNDPARLVKLKKRQLNESPLDSKSGKSYMEKFLETPPAQKKPVYEISGTLPLRLTVDNSSESGPETLDISAMSPVKVSSQGKETLSSSPTLHEIVLKPSLEELNEEAIDRDIMKVPEPTFAFRDGIPHSLHKVTTEEEIILDGEGMEECNIYGDHSDGMSSEADNFIDAISTMESEMDTDNEYRPKGGVGFMDIGKYQTGSHANEEKFGVQAHSSDSQSDRISSLSDDRSCSIDKRISSFSNSDTIDNPAKDMPPDGEIAAEVFPSNRNSVTEIGEVPPIQLPTCLEIQCPSSDQVLLPEDISFGVHCLPDLGEASYSSCLEDLNSTLNLQDEASSEAIPSLEQQHEEVPSDGKTSSNLSDSDAGKYLDDSSEKQVTLNTLSAESHSVDELSFVDTNVLSDALPYSLNVLQVSHEKESDNGHLNEILKTDFAGEICAENSVNQTIGLPHCIISSKEEQHLRSTLEGGERSSGIILSPEPLDIAKPINFVSEVSDATVEVDLNLECTSHVVDTSQICGINEQQLSDLLHNDPKVESDLTEIKASQQEKKILSDKESELKYSSHLMESKEEALCSPTYYQSGKENSLVLSLDIHAYQHDVEKLHIVEDGSRQIQSLDPIDQENCLQTSFEHSKEGSSSEPSLEFSEQSDRQGKQESYPSNTIHPALCLHPEATKVIMEEMPPLPPLPPMQWRIGRVQHVSTAPQRELVEHGQLAADFMQPSPFSMHLATMGSNSNSQYNGFCSDGTHSVTLPTTSNENLEYRLFSMVDDRVESNYSLHMPPTDAIGRHIPVSLHEETANCPNQFVLDTSLEGVTCQDPKQNFVREYGNPPDVFVPLPTKREEQILAKVAEDLPAKVEEQIPAKVAEDLPVKVEEQFPTKADKQPQHGLAASEGEKAQTSNAVVQHGLAAPEGEISQINTTLEPDLSTINTTLEPDLSTSEGEVAWPSNTLDLVHNAEEGNSSGNPPVKLPRPRNPLIDAVAAHGKSKLRKVTEQNRPPIIPKVDERDSLLEQIRTKSNLKPAAVTRPRVQGPKTNMRVAAILEKANAIRQALAGSDEEDDEDGWSDS